MKGVYVMERNSHSFSKKRTSPFRGIGNGIKEMMVGVRNFIRNDELQELSESLELTMSNIAVSLDMIRKAAEKQREQYKPIDVHKYIKSEHGGLHGKLVKISGEAGRIGHTTKA